MGDPVSGLLGQNNHTGGLQDRVHQESSIFGTLQVNPDSQIQRSESGLREGNFRSAPEKGHLHCGRKQVSQPTPLIVFPDSKKARFLASNHQPQTYQQSFHSPEEVQDGKLGCHPSFSSTRPVGYINRPEGRLPPRSNSPFSPTVPVLPVPKRRLLLQSHAVWPFDRTSGVHPHHQNSLGIPKKERNSHLRISRRLAPSSPLLRGSHPHNHLHHQSAQPPRLDSERAKVIPSTKSGRNLFRRRTGFPRRNRISHPRENPVSNPVVNPTIKTSSRPSQTMVKTSGPNGEHGRHHPVLQIVHETFADPPTQTLHTGEQSTVQTGSSDRGRLASHFLVDASTQCCLGKEVCGTSPEVIHHDGCLHDRLGSSVGLFDSLRPLGRLPQEPPHQSVGDGSSLPGHQPMETLPQRPHDYCIVRQLDHSLLHQSPRRNQVSIPLSEDMETSTSVQTAQHSSQGNSSSGPAQCHGRCPLPRNPIRDGVVTLPDMGQPHFPNLRQTNGGPLCVTGQRQTTNLLHQAVSSPSMDDRRPGLPLEQSICLRLPSVVPDPESSFEAEGVQRNPAPGSSLLAQPTVVSHSPGDAGGSSVQISNQGQSAHSERREDLPSTSETPPSDCLESFIRRYTNKGLSQEAAVIASGARRPSTVSTYNSRLSKFKSWSTERGVDPVAAPVSSISEFLLMLFSEGKQVSTIRNYRSAISSIHNGFPDGSTIGSNEAISHLLKGMFNKRPPRKRLPPSWAINDVLSGLAVSPYEPMDNTSLELLTYKTLFLVAAASGRRRSEIHALTIKKGFIRFSQDGVFLLPDPRFLTKNETASFTPGEIYLPNISSSSSIPEDRKLCPVRALKWYLQRTKQLRSSDNLFIIPKSPYGPASKDTISKWIVKLIMPHASPDDPVHAHQLRAQSASRAWFDGVSLPDILKAAAWKTPSTFVSCYLTDVVSREGAFARSALGVPVQRRRPVLPPTSRC